MICKMNDSKSIGLCRAILFGMFILVAFVFGVTMSDTQSQMDEERTNSRLLEVVTVSDTLRLSLAAKSNANGLGSANFDKNWTEEILPYFKSDEIQLLHFFSFALMLVGRLDEQRTVVGFYSPWVDSMFLTAWKERAIDGWKIDDFVWLAGETFRGQKVPKDVTAFVPAWLRTGRALAPSIIELSGKTISQFEKLFPLRERYEFPVIQLPQTPEAELAIVKGRMTFRLAYAKEKLAGPIGESVQKHVENVKRVLLAGDKSLLTALTSPEQNAYVAETIELLPEEMRRTMNDHWCVVNEKQAVVVLSSALSPRWFLLVFLDFERSDHPLRAVNLYDFETMRTEMQKKEVD